MRLPAAMSADQLVAELLNHYRVFHKPDSPEEAMWSRSMAAVLGGWSESVLARACEVILRTRKNDRFPLPAEISSICREIADEDERPKLLAAEYAARQSNAASRERKMFAVELLRGEMGRRAVRENWIGGLYDFVRRQNRLPDAREEGMVVRSHREYESARDGVYRVARHGALNGALAALAASIDKRNRLLCDVVVGRADVSALVEHLDQWAETDEASGRGQHELD